MSICFIGGGLEGGGGTVAAEDVFICWRSGGVNPLLVEVDLQEIGGVKEMVLGSGVK